MSLHFLQLGTDINAQEQDGCALHNAISEKIVTKRHLEHSIRMQETDIYALLLPLYQGKRKLTEDIFKLVSKY